MGAVSRPDRTKVHHALAVVVSLLAVVALASCAGGDDEGDRGDGGTGGTQGSVAYQSADITGTPLPPMTDGGSDPAAGRTIPTVVGKSFDGTVVTIEPGKPQVLAFLAHWCPHCQAEVPKLVEWQASGELTDDVEMVGVSTSANEAQGNFPPASWLEREKWTNTTLADTPTNEVLDAFGVTSFPTLIAVTADGAMARRASGELTLDQVQELWDAARGA